MDAGGGAPFGQDFRLVAEAVADGGVEALEQGAAFGDQPAVAHGAAGGVLSVARLGVGLVRDGGEIGLQVGDETGRPPASTMRATGPTARPAQALAHLVEADLDAALAGLFFPGRADPADPLVPRQWRDVQPQAFGVGIGIEGVA